MEHNKGAWIFVSHSTKDWEQVRKIRNLLENKGHRPLLFFLKCLNEHSELDTLIKREIDARNWFILCDSKNAKKSKWVQEEISYIKNLKNKYFETIDLSDSIEDQMKIINKLSKNITIYISYSSYDIQIARKIKKELENNDFTVWFAPDNIKIGENFAEQTCNAIDNAINKGFVIVLLSKKSINSPIIKREVNYAFKNKNETKYNSNILSIYLDDIEEIPLAFKNINAVHLSKNNFKKNIKEVIKYIKSHIPYFIDNNTLDDE